MVKWGRKKRLIPFGSASSYSYSLDFSNFSIDVKNLTAQINVEERNEVVFNISKLANQKNPIVSGTRVFHEFHFVKEESGWKIEADIYEDDLWKILKNNNLSFTKIKTNIDEYIAYKSLNQSILTDNQSLLLSGYCPDLRADSTSHDYNREEAAAYAVRFAYDYNPNYIRFPKDCTNFVSQAIVHGGPSQMAYPALEYQGDPGSMGWYYTNGGDYAAAWTWVDGLYTFITDETAMYSYDDGPEGCVLENQSYLNLGDIVQFDDEDDDLPEGVWNHSVMVTDILYLGFGEKEYFISAHTTDHRNYPLSYLIAYFDHIRYIRIDRIDGEFHVFVPITIKNYSSGYTMSEATQNNNTNMAYPAPGTELILQPTETIPAAHP